MRRTVALAGYPAKPMEANMREDLEIREDDDIIELGAASELTNGDPIQVENEGALKPQRKAD